ncbi:MAG: 50S ribosomal protein L9 [Varibaculum sp.]|nr:50S ribosomal protein L9 [Varibaculum sp.]
MRTVKVILLGDVANLGAAGDVVSVRPGYARNYLQPRNLAQPWSERAQRQIDIMNRATRRRQIANEEDAREVRDRLEASDGIRIAKRTGEGNRLYGSVSQRDIAEALKDQLNQTIDYRKVQITTPIKTTGDYTVTLRLHDDVTASLPVAIYSEK